MKEEQAATARRNSAYVKNDCKGLLSLIAKLEKPLTSPNWENEKVLLQRQCKLLRTSLSALEKALND